GAWMVGRQFTRLAQVEAFGENLKGNVKAGMKVTALGLAAAEHTRQQLFHRFGELFERFDILLTPAAPVRPYPVEMNFPNEINGQKFDHYIDWIAPAFLITLVSLPAGSVPAGKTRDGLPVGLQIVAPRFEEPRILSLAKLVQQAHPIGWPPHAWSDGRSARYCMGGMPALLMVSSHLGASDAKNLASSSGVVEAPSASCSMILAVTDGSLTAATSSSLSLAMIGFGVPWGANSPSHPDASSFLIPASATVGTSVSTVIRLLAAATSALASPLWRGALTFGSRWYSTSTAPAIRSDTYCA